MIKSDLMNLEHDALTNALTEFFAEQGFDSRSPEARHSGITYLKDNYLEFYLKSPEIEKNHSSFEFSEQNILAALEPKPNGKLRPRLCPRHKARFLIWALEHAGHYKRPKHVPVDNFHDSFVDYVYKNEEEQYSLSKTEIERLIGVYLVKRLSFNNAFPDYATVCRMWIWYDENNKILRYRTANKYKQNIKNEVVDRDRWTQGYLFKFQRNILFIADVQYSHLHAAEGTETTSDKKTENKENDVDVSHYPEIMLAHMHGGDSHIRGLILGNYPFLNLPVATSILMKKDGPRLSSNQIEKNYKKYFAGLSSKDIDEFDPYVGIKKLAELGEDARFITNSLESKYSNMLTP